MGIGCTCNGCTRHDSRILSQPRQLQAAFLPRQRVGICSKLQNIHACLRFHTIGVVQQHSCEAVKYEQQAVPCGTAFSRQLIAQDTQRSWTCVGLEIELTTLVSEKEAKPSYRYHHNDHNNKGQLNSGESP